MCEKARLCAIIYYSRGKSKSYFCSFTIKKYSNVKGNIVSYVILFVNCHSNNK